jgi:hypothetical protein
MDITKELNEEEILTCAYCQSKFKNKAELSKHIDIIHTGLGLLEGNRGSGKSAILVSASTIDHDWIYHTGPMGTNEHSFASGFVYA